MRGKLARLTVVGALTVACARDPALEPGEPGQALYASQCAACHGAGGAGSSLGPPLLVEMYGPASFSDESIVTAVRDGVPAGKWDFGPMPMVGGLSEEEVAEIVGYVRHLQEAAGIR